MNSQNIKDLLDNVINLSKYKNSSNQEREAVKKKLVQKYLNDFNETALELLDAGQKKEFSKLLASQNQEMIENYISENISDLKNLTKLASQKFSNEAFLLLK